MGKSRMKLRREELWAEGLSRSISNLAACLLHSAQRRHFWNPAEVRGRADKTRVWRESRLGASQDGVTEDKSRILFLQPKAKQTHVGSEQVLGRFILYIFTYFLIFFFFTISIYYF